MPGSAATLPRPLELGLRLLLAYGIAIAVAHIGGREFVAWTLPLLRNVLASFDEREQILALAIVPSGADTVVKMTAKLLHDIMVEGRSFRATGYTFMSTIGVGLMLQPAVIASGLVLAWPVRRLVEYALRVGVAVVLLAIVLVADAPLTLWANYLHISMPETFSLLWLWEEFLVHGGRLALGLLTALVAIEAARSIMRRHTT